MLQSFFPPLLQVPLHRALSLFSSLAAVEIPLFLSDGWSIQILDQFHSYTYNKGVFCMISSHAKEIAFFVHPCNSGRYWWRLCGYVEVHRSVFCSFPLFVSFFMTADGTGSTSETQEVDKVSCQFITMVQSVDEARVTRNKDTSTTVLIDYKALGINFALGSMQTAFKNSLKN